jgi:hypothetical protein
LRRLVGRRDEWLLEQAEWLLSWGPASAEAYAVLDAMDRPRARALGLERALRDVTASWFWAVVARAIVDGAEDVAWARTIVERDAEVAVSIARELGEAHAWTEPVAAFFDVVARFDRLLSGPSRDELAFWRRRVGESSGFGGG